MDGLQTISGEQLERLRRTFPEGGEISCVAGGTLYEGVIRMVVECGACKTWSTDDGVEQLVPAIKKYMAWVQWSHLPRKIWIELEPGSELEYRGKGEETEGLPEEHPGDPEAGG